VGCCRFSGTRVSRTDLRLLGRSSQTARGDANPSRRRVTVSFSTATIASLALSEEVNRFLGFRNNHPVFETAVARRELKRLMTPAGWSTGTAEFVPPLASLIERLLRESAARCVQLTFDFGLSADSNIGVRNLSREAPVGAGQTLKTKVIGYWVTTAILAFVLLAGDVADLANRPCTLSI
jgi:hypothetical protein